MTKRARVGLIVALGAWGMLLGSLLFALFVVRLQAEVWPPPQSPPLPFETFALAGALLASGTGSAWLGRSLLRRGKPKGLAGQVLLGSCLLLLGFLFVQGGLFALGRRAGGQGAFGGAYLLFSLLHLVNVALGLLALGAVVFRTFTGRYGPARHSGVSATCLYLTFSAAAWAALFGLVHLP